MKWFHGGRTLALLASLAAATGPDMSRAAESGNDEVQALKREIEDLRRRETEMRRQLDDLQRRVERATGAAGSPASPTSPASPAAADAGKAANALDEALGRAKAEQAKPAAKDDILSRQVGPARLRLLDVSFVTLGAVGWSSADDGELEGLEAGAHDPLRRGFTLQQAELSFTGAVDPYLNGEAHIVYTPGGVELEEAFMTTQTLPFGLQIQAGHFFTRFGLVNPLHPHAWEWVDQPLINSRLFGGDGLRAPGARVGWLTPLPWFSEAHFGVQNANDGETTVSFLGDDEIGGRPVVHTSTDNAGDLLYLARWNNAWNLTDEWTLLQGVSGLHGPNSTGSDGETWIYGADLKLRWRPRDNFRGWPFLIWQSEVSKRDYDASVYSSGTVAEEEPDGHGHAEEEEEEEGDEAEDVDLPAGILRDYGFYSQVLYGFRHGWAAGLRYEYAGGKHSGGDDRNDDPLRDDRHRLSPLLVWQPSEFSRFRLQYNFDHAQHLNGHDAHSVWLGGEILYGAHPAHQF